GGRRSDELRRRSCRPLPARCHPCRQDPQGRQARRYSHRAAHEVRVDHQPQDRQGARPDDPAVAPAAGGSGDRVSRTGKPTPPPRAPEPPKKSRKPLPGDMARDAIAHEEAAPGDKVRMTLRVVLPRSAAEALAARAIRREMNIGALITEILEAAAAE